MEDIPMLNIEKRQVRIKRQIRIGVVLLKTIGAKTTQIRDVLILSDVWRRKRAKFACIAARR